MIVTDVGGLAEIIPDEKVGYVVKPVISEITDAILKFYQQNKENDFSANARIEKEKYSWNNMLKAIEQI